MFLLQDGMDSTSESLAQSYDGQKEILGEISEGRRSRTIFAISQQIQTMLEGQQAIGMAKAVQFDYMSRLLEPLQEGKPYTGEPSIRGADV